MMVLTAEVSLPSSPFPFQMLNQSCHFVAFGFAIEHQRRGMGPPR